MFKVVKKEIEVAGKKISLETGKIARQADGAIIAQCGETVVLATAVGAKKVNPDVDYFPLSVNYQEKYYAAGKIPGGYFKREARPTESETLISRLIDRPIRPLFPDEFKNEVQVLPTVISYDKENEADILSIIASSAALAISGMPFLGPVGASRVGFIDGKYVLNPSKLSIFCSSSDVPRVVVTIACVSPLVNNADPWTLGRIPTSHIIGLTSAKPLPSIRFLFFNMSDLTIVFSRFLSCEFTSKSV